MNPVGPYNPYAEKQGLCAIRVFTDARNRGRDDSRTTPGDKLSSNRIRDPFHFH